MMVQLDALCDAMATHSARALASFTRRQLGICPPLAAPKQKFCNSMSVISLQLLGNWGALERPKQASCRFRSFMTVHGPWSPTAMAKHISRSLKSVMSLQNDGKFGVRAIA